MQVLVGRRVVDRAVAGEHGRTGPAHRARLPKQLAQRDRGVAVERAAGQFQIRDAGRGAGEQRAAIEPHHAGAIERARLVDGEQAGIHLHRTRTCQGVIAADQIARCTVRSQEQRCAVRDGNPPARRRCQRGCAVVAAVVALIEIDVAIRRGGQRAGRSDMQRAAVTDVEVVIGAVAEGQHAGDFKPALQVLVRRCTVDRAIAGEHGRARADHRAGLPQQLTQRGGGRAVQRTAGHFQIGDLRGGVGGQRAAIEPQHTGTTEFARLIDGEQTAVELNGAGPAQRKVAAEVIAGRAVCRQEKRSAVRDGDSPTCVGSDGDTAVVAAVAAFVQIDVAIGRRCQGTGVRDVQRAAIADVQIVVGAVSEGQRAGDIKPAMQELVGARRTDGCHRACRQHGAPGTGHGATRPVESVADREVCGACQRAACHREAARDARIGVHEQRAAGHEEGARPGDLCAVEMNRAGRQLKRRICRDLQRLPGHIEGAGFHQQIAAVQRRHTHPADRGALAVAVAMQSQQSAAALDVAADVQVLQVGIAAAFTLGQRAQCSQSATTGRGTRTAQHGVVVQQQRAAFGNDQFAIDDARTAQRDRGIEHGAAGTAHIAAQPVEVVAQHQVAAADQIGVRQVERAGAADDGIAFERETTAGHRECAGAGHVQAC